MRPVLLFFASLFIVIVIIVVSSIVWYNWDTLITPDVRSDYLNVEERYIIEPSNQFRVVQFVTGENAVINGLDNVARHETEDVANPLRYNNSGKKHYVYLKKDTPYTISVFQKSNNVIWHPS